jgi:hypothetical protein
MYLKLALRSARTAVKRVSALADGCGVQRFPIALRAKIHVVRIWALVTGNRTDFCHASFFQPLAQGMQAKSTTKTNG